LLIDKLRNIVIGVPKTKIVKLQVTLVTEIRAEEFETKSYYLERFKIEN